MASRYLLLLLQFSLAEKIQHLTPSKIPVSVWSFTSSPHGRITSFHWSDCLHRMRPTQITIDNGPTTSSNRSLMRVCKSTTPLAIFEDLIALQCKVTLTMR